MFADAMASMDSIRYHSMEGSATGPYPVGAEQISSHGEEDALIRDGRLIYVAVTRTKTELLLLYTGTVTPMLPTKSSLHRRVSP